MNASAPASHSARCLIAADIDKTILDQNKNERQSFILNVSPCLFDAARTGASLALVTGNSMHQVAERLLPLIVRELCNREAMHLLDRFHFFSNSGGVYFHFPADAMGSAKPQNRQTAGRSICKNKVLRTITKKHGESAIISPVFIDEPYLEKCRIPSRDIAVLSQVMSEVADAYCRKIKRGPKSLIANYDLGKISSTGSLVRPIVELRPVKYGADHSRLQAHVQLTLKPVLSFRHAKTEALRDRLFENDLRTWVIGEIQQRLDYMGLGHYEAKAGGTSSVDVTLEKVDKGYAMRFLIERLNLQGHERLGEKFGTNAVYFGDEVIVGGGNDYPVTKIPGLLVFAVNNDRHLVPFHSRILIPSVTAHGPEATAHILRAFNTMAFARLSNTAENNKRHRGCFTPTVLETFKREMFAGRVLAKIKDITGDHHATGDDWQALNAIVTLMHRQDRDSSRWMDILINELDDIMEQIARHPNGHKQAAIGASHPDIWVERER